MWKFSCMEVMRGKWKKVKTEPTIMGNRPSTYNLRTHQELFSRNPKTVRYGTETISFLAPKIWAVVPQKYETSHLSFII